VIAIFFSQTPEKYLQTSIHHTNPACDERASERAELSSRVKLEAVSVLVGKSLLAVVLVGWLVGWFPQIFVYI
jgi:F0F1-type ATP synthase assembly protein I